MSDSEVNKIENDVPVPVVTFSRWVYAIVLGASLVFQFPFGITILLALILPGLLFGRRWNFIGRVAKVILKKRLANAETEDRRLIQFNNILLVLMLIAAQVAFLAGLHGIAWTIIGAVIGITGLALSGYCVGCLFYYRFKLYRYKFSITN